MSGLRRRHPRGPPNHGAPTQTGNHRLRALAYTEQGVGVAFTSPQSDWPLSMDGGDLIFGMPPQGFYLHPAN